MSFSVIPVFSPGLLPLARSTPAPGLVRVALAASLCHYKGISVDVNGLFVGTSRTI